MSLLLSEVLFVVADALLFVFEGEVGERAVLAALFVPLEREGLE